MSETELDPTIAQLSELIAELEHRRPTRAEARLLPEVYRRAMQQLAAARGRLPNAGDLEVVVQRAHAVLYAPVADPIGASLLSLARTFPAQVRGAWRPIALALGLMALGTLWGDLEVRRSPSSAEVFLPEALQHNADRFGDPASDRAGDPLTAPLYFTHNMRVALGTFAFGATFGVGTVLLLLANGLFLGATAALVARAHASRELLSWLLPHAGIELSAIAIAAAAGLRMGAALWRPGPRRRRDALAEAARAALPLALGSALLLILAGGAEAWIAPQPWPLATKAAIGLTLDAVLLAIVLLGGRGAPAGKTTDSH